MQMYTSIRVTENDKRILELAQDELKKRGYASLENIPITCPKCNQTMNGVKVTAEHWECSACGYSENGLTMGVAGTFAIGAIAGVAAVALLWWLHEQSKKG